MILREVTDENNTLWTCVQAFSGGSDEIAKKAARLAESDQGMVAVVCTPTGGAQSVRLELDSNWKEQISDEQLVAAIGDERGRSQ